MRRALYYSASLQLPGFASSAYAFPGHQGHVAASCKIVLPKNLSQRRCWLVRRYVETYRDLQKLAACMHLSESPPDAVVVDDICSFADAG